MENEILENGTTPETEIVQEPETVVTEPTAETTETPAATGNKITEALGKAADKGKEMIANPKAVWEKIKAVPKKVWIGIGAGVAAILALILCLSIFTNTYKTPVKAMQNIENNKKASATYNKRAAALNGFCEKEYKQLINIIKKSDDYEDYLDNWEDTIDSKKDRYGDNYKYTYKVEDKDKLDKDELKAMQKNLRSLGRSLADASEDMDSDDYDEMADNAGIKKGQAKKFVKIAEKIGKKLKNAKVTAGYTLTLEGKLTGSEVDDSEPIEDTITVYKINGRWVSEKALNYLFSALSFG